MRSIEKTGKKTEDAINAGLKELGVDLADVTIDILDAGSPGLFGMFGRLAKVRLTVKEDDLEFEMPEFSLDAKKTKPAKAAPKPEKPAKPAPAPVEEKPAEITQTDEAPEDATEDEPAAEKQPREGKRSRSQRSRREPKPVPEETVVTEERAVEEPFEPTDPETLGHEGRMAYDFLKNLTEKMGVEVAIRVREEEDHLSIAMMGDTLGILIGRRGDTLDALQYLTSLLVNRHRDTYMRVSVDTENYRARREEALTKLALRMANRARKTGRKVTMEPMNPYERRVLHSALQGHPYVTTHSEGEEPYRRVIITLKGDEE